MIELTKEKETMLIPLYGKALDFGNFTIIFDAYSCLRAKHAHNHP